MDIALHIVVLLLLGSYFTVANVWLAKRQGRDERLWGVLGIGFGLFAMGTLLLLGLHQAPARRRFEQECPGCRSADIEPRRKGGFVCNLCDYVF